VAISVAIYEHITALPPQWEHDPTLKDKYDRTVAMHAAYRGHANVLPPPMGTRSHSQK